MTREELEILVILIVTLGLVGVLTVYVGWKLTKIGKGLKDIAEGLQKLGKSPRKKGGS